MKNVSNLATPQGIDFQRVVELDGTFWTAVITFVITSCRLAVWQENRGERMGESVGGRAEGVRTLKFGTPKLDELRTPNSEPNDKLRSRELCVNLWNLWEISGNGQEIGSEHRIAQAAMQNGPTSTQPVPPNLGGEGGRQSDIRHPMRSV
jgi:hypothetical protein